MTHYIDAYPNEVKIQGTYSSIEFENWIKCNNIIGWSWTWIYSQDATYFYFNYIEDAVLFQLTFG